jgi:hypothetical protein
LFPILFGEVFFVVERAQEGFLGLDIIASLILLDSGLDKILRDLSNGLRSVTVISLCRSRSGQCRGQEHHCQQND